MKKYVLSILSLILLISPVFADSLGPVVYNASGSRLYISYGYNYSNIYRLPNYNRCGEAQFFGIGNYSDYLAGSFNFTGSSDTVSYGNTGNYVYGYNNGFFLNNNVTTSLSFYGSIYKTGLACTSNTPITGNFSYFSFGFDSSNNLHNIIYFPNFGFRIGPNWSLINSPGVLLYSSDSSLVSSSVNTGFNNFVYIDSNRNTVFYFDDYRLYSNYGSFNDVPDGFQRKKFLVNGDFTYSSIYSLSGNYDFLSVVDSGIIANGGDFPSFSVSPNYGYFLFHIVDYSQGYYSANSSTFILAKTDSGIVYNAYNIFSNDISELLSLSPVRKGYLTGNFNSFVNSDGQYFEIYGSYSNGITFRLYDFDTYSLYSNFSFSFIEDSTVPVINLDGSTSNLPLTTGSVESGSISKCMNDVNYYHLNSLFCNSLGVYIGSDGVPVLHTSPSCLKIIQAFNDSGDLVELTVSCDDAQNFLSGGFYQDSSGNIFYKCFGDTCLYTNTSQYFQSGIVSDSYYNSDSVFFSCPYPIITGSNNILSRFSNLQLGQYSIGLPILCFYSSFVAGKNYKLFSGFDSGLSQPLFGNITSSTDDRVYLFKFLDIILGLGILFFLLKLYHLTK